MRYHSTRGGASNVSFEQAISTGYAPDGGLYVPEALPRVDTAELQRLATLSFAELAEAILRKFIDPEEVTSPLCARAGTSRPSSYLLQKEPV